MVRQPGVGRCLAVRREASASSARRWSRSSSPGSPATPRPQGAQARDGKRPCSSAVTSTRCDALVEPRVDVVPAAPRRARARRRGGTTATTSRRCARPAISRQCARARRRERLRASRCPRTASTSVTIERIAPRDPVERARVDVVSLGERGDSVPRQRLERNCDQGRCGSELTEQDLHGMASDRARRPGSCEATSTGTESIRRAKSRSTSSGRLVGPMEILERRGSSACSGAELVERRCRDLDTGARRASRPAKVAVRPRMRRRGSARAAAA